jgi:transcriptional regulator with XRE-family HTH domain
MGQLPCTSQGQMHHSGSVTVWNVKTPCTIWCIRTIMSGMENTTEGLAPALTLGDRLHIARTVLNTQRRAEAKKPLSSSEFAKEVGVHRNTITRYEQNETKPSKGDLMLWAAVCNVPLEWLAGHEECAPWDSNPEPAGFGKVLVNA